MSDPETIDLTDSPTLVAASGSQVLPPKVLSTNTHDGEKNPKKKQRKRKRKQNQQSGTQSQDSTAANTRSNSDEETTEEVHSQDTRQVRRKRESSTATKENAPSTLASQDRISSSKKQRQKEDPPSSGHIVTGNANPADLFFEDITPAPLPSNIGNPPPPPYNIADSSCQNTNDTKLLLPAHVSVLGSTPVEILPPTESDEDADTDYIKYLDYGGDRQKEFLRYFEEPEDESVKLKRTVCKNCGAEGDHKTADCRILICLTCGVRDEHVTKSCPVSKICFSCGMKGHINNNCPNRRMGRTRDHGNGGRCNRCYSEIHQTSECPTWWRLYVYVTDEDRSRILAERRSKRDLKMGKGGEGYIAEDEWCFNCGEVGHWGDDCKAAHRQDRPVEPSAFGLHSISTGPFYDPEETGTSSRPERRPRDWERDVGAWNMHTPNGVGMQGKKKMMEKMRKNAQKVEEESDPDDWFGNVRNARNRGVAPSGPSSDRDRDHRRDRGRERHRDRVRDRERTREDRDREKRWERDRDRERDRERDRNRERDRDWDRTGARELERGPDRRPERERDGNREQPFGADKDGRDKVKFSIPKPIGTDRTFLPPASHGLPARPSGETRPTLLERMAGNSVGDPKNPRGPLSIKGAGQRQSRDDDRTSRNYHSGRQSGPRYQGGYGR